MNIYQIIWRTEAEGPGCRTAIWTQGCSRHCKGCFLPMTWNHETRFTYTPANIIKHIDDDIEGITVLGGEPFEQSDDLLELLHHAKQRNLSTIVFTGYTYSDLKNQLAEMNVFQKYIDVLVDGFYDETSRNFDVPMIGSLNQKFYFFSDKYHLKDFPSNKIEVHISKNGAVRFSGMGDFEKIKAFLEDDDAI